MKLIFLMMSSSDHKNVQETENTSQHRELLSNDLIDRLNRFNRSSGLKRMNTEIKTEAIHRTD